jgi:hypothetical protein
LRTRAVEEVRWAGDVGSVAAVPSPAATDSELDEIEASIDTWLAAELADNPVVAAVDRAEERGLRRWYVRLLGEEKDFTTVWFTLGQRTLRYETYVMPAPEEDHARFYEHLLRRNERLTGAAFTIGDEDAVFLKGALPVAAITTEELDRVLGSLYAYVEQCFRPALRIGYASRFKG